MGWFENQAGPEEKQRLFAQLGHKVPINQLHWELVRLAMSSVANLAIIPMQDILGLGAEARMNLPGSVDKKNWSWRLNSRLLTLSITRKLKTITRDTRRTPL
jgi:4-alpha-glucanotransferase